MQDRTLPSLLLYISVLLIILDFILPRMKALKILHSESSGGWGGQEVRTLKEMLALRERGHIVEIVCPRDARIGGGSAELGFSVHHARMRYGGALRSMLSIGALLRR